MPPVHSAHPAHSQHHGPALAKVTGACQKYGVDPTAFQSDIDAALKTPAVTRLFELIEQGDPAAQAEGAARLRLTLTTVLGLVDHVIDHVTGAGGTAPPELLKVKAGLESALN